MANGSRIGAWTRRAGASVRSAGLGTVFGRQLAGVPGDTSPSSLPGRRPRRRFVILNGLLVLGVAGAATAAYLGLREDGAAGARQAARTVTASRGVVLSTVSATGNVATPDQLNVNFETAGTLESLSVAKGQKVKRGQVLARIDATAARDGVRTAVSGLQSAEAHLQQLLDGETAAERAQDAISVHQAEQALANAKASLAQTKSGNATSLTTSKLSLDQAAAQLKRDQAQLRTDRSDLAKAQQTVTAAQTAYDASTATVTAAKDKLTADQTALANVQAQQTTDQGNSSAHQQQLSKDQSALSEAKSGLQSAQATLEKAQAQLAQDQDACTADPTSPACGSIAADQAAVTAATAAVTSAQSTVNAAQSAVNGDLSQQSSDTSTSTSNSLAVAAANRQVTASQGALTDAQSAQQDAKSTLTTAQNDVTTAQNAIASDSAKIVTDRNQVSTQSVGVRSTEQKNAQSLASARQAVASAQTGKSSAVLAKQVKEEPAKQGDLEAARAAVVTAQAGLATARQTLAETVLRAPSAGTVASVSGRAGQTVQGGGTTSGSNSSSSSSGSGSQTPLVTLVDLGGLTVTAGFSESDAAKITVGKPATITLDALPEKKLAAHVVSIDTLSTVTSNVVTYNVTFALDRTTAGVKPGMSASVDVVANERDNVVNVPSSAVTGTGANASVTVLRNGVQTRVAVVAGLQGDSTTEIVSGLAAGTAVVLPASTFSGTSSNANRNGTFGGLGGGGLGGGNRPAVFVGPGG